jgi:hypothetical protein
MSNSISQFALLSVHNNRLKRITRASSILICIQWCPLSAPPPTRRSQVRRAAFVIEEELRYEAAYQDRRKGNQDEAVRMYPYLLLLQSIFSFTCIASCICCLMYVVRRLITAAFEY